MSNYIVASMAIDVLIAIATCPCNSQYSMTCQNDSLFSEAMNYHDNGCTGVVYGWPSNGVLNCADSEDECDQIALATILPYCSTKVQILDTDLKYVVDYNPAEFNVTKTCEEQCRCLTGGSGKCEIRVIDRAGNGYAPSCSTGKWECICSPSYFICRDTIWSTYNRHNINLGELVGFDETTVANITTVCYP